MHYYSASFQLFKLCYLSLRNVKMQFKMGCFAILGKTCDSTRHKNNISIYIANSSRLPILKLAFLRVFRCFRGVRVSSVGNHATYNIITLPQRHYIIHKRRKYKARDFFKKTFDRDNLRFFAFYHAPPPPPGLPCAPGLASVLPIPPPFLPAPILDPYLLPRANIRRQTQ